MALSHKDWEPPNSGIWLAESDIDRGLDFPNWGLDRKCFEVKELQTKIHWNYWLFSFNNIDFCKWQKADEKKKVKGTSKLWKNEIRLVAVRKRIVS